MERQRDDEILHLTRRRSMQSMQRHPSTHRRSGISRSTLRSRDGRTSNHILSFKASTIERTTKPHSSLPKLLTLIKILPKVTLTEAVLLKDLEETRRVEGPGFRSRVEFLLELRRRDDLRRVVGREGATRSEGSSSTNVWKGIVSTGTRGKESSRTHEK